ncbi:ABC transporter permease [Oleiharenicola sp. Vm1]|uniref:ABC transporter permease n=1 Tax=Oleiharenicola sp. Vm1 TaxID=3398393 RepID=UPI0039F4959F
MIWSIVTPLLLLALYVLVFGFIFGGRFRADATAETRIEYALVVFLGLAIHHFVSEIMALGPTLILANPNFVKKVVFPLEILPAAAVGSAALHFGITLSLVFIGALVTGAPLGWGVLWLPVILLPLLIGAFGVALALAALGVFWRDIAQVTQFFALALLFASAVFYPVSQIPGGVWYFLRFNPLIHFIDEARAVTFWHRSPNPVHVGYLYASAALLLVVGATAFKRLRCHFADVL